MKQDVLNYINNTFLNEASKLRYIVKSVAPSTEAALYNEAGLIVWSGASDNTIYQDKCVNWAFRALHDALHLETGLNFSVDSEIELGRIQASKYSSRLIQELVFCEVAGQAIHFRNTGNFVTDQVEFTLSYLRQRGLL